MIRERHNDPFFVLSASYEPPEILRNALQAAHLPTIGTMPFKARMTLTKNGEVYVASGYGEKDKLLSYMTCTSEDVKTAKF